MLYLAGKGDSNIRYYEIKGGGVTGSEPKALYDGMVQWPEYSTGTGSGTMLSTAEYCIDNSLPYSDHSVT